MFSFWTIFNFINVILQAGVQNRRTAVKIFLGYSQSGESSSYDFYYKTTEGTVINLLWLAVFPNSSILFIYPLLLETKKKMLKRGITQWNNFIGYQIIISHYSYISQHIHNFCKKELDYSIYFTRFIRLLSQQSVNLLRYDERCGNAFLKKLRAMYLFHVSGIILTTKKK